LSVVYPKRRYTLEPTPDKQVDDDRREFYRGMGVGVIPLGVVLLSAILALTDSYHPEVSWGDQLFACASFLWAIFLVFALVFTASAGRRLYGLGMLVMCALDPFLAMAIYGVVSRVGH
jgi:hypothetical protein